ncbi:MAG TPA: hypothetical protein VFG54_11245, partial [Prolixibacteraceae bacterium]|nr:hypothetical protein [Prolixibacteraceae bacterium]
WFAGNIKDLKPTPTLDWLQHAFAPSATYINLTDERYVRMVEPHQPGSNLLFNLAGVNNYPSIVSGSVKVKLLDGTGKSVLEQVLNVKLQPYVRTDIPVSIQLPEVLGGYVLVAEFTPENGKAVISRRFLKVGQAASYTYFNLSPISK